MDITVIVVSVRFSLGTFKEDKSWRYKSFSERKQKEKGKVNKQNSTKTEFLVQELQNKKFNGCVTLILRYYAAARFFAELENTM